MPWPVWALYPSPSMCLCVLTAGLDKLPRLVSPMLIALMRQIHAGWIEPAWRGACTPFKWGRGSGFLCVFVCFSLGCSCIVCEAHRLLNFGNQRWSMWRPKTRSSFKGKVFSRFSPRYSSSLRLCYILSFSFLFWDRSNNHWNLTSRPSWWWRMEQICIIMIISGFQSIIMYLFFLLGNKYICNNIALYS